MFKRPQIKYSFSSGIISAGEASNRWFERLEPSLMGMIILGLMLTLCGISYYLVSFEIVSFQELFPFLLGFLGFLLILYAVVMGLVARRRNPIP